MAFCPSDVYHRDMTNPSVVFLHYDREKQQASSINFYSRAEARAWLESKLSSLDELQYADSAVT
jgi:hypothetical protein